MKPKRLYFHPPVIFGATLRYGAPIYIGFTVIISGLDARAGDLLRGGSSSSNVPGRSAGSGVPTPSTTDAARANARDMLARTDRTLASLQAMQKAARQAARENGKNNLGKNPLNSSVKLPNVPNGIALGGLQVSPEVALDPSKWIGAKLPKQEVSKGKTTVTIKQTEQQALLEWQTFNVGSKTTLTFDQSKGGENVGEWIAFNKISDPSGNPTQILGRIKSDGQIYLINPNGIIFGGGSVVNARGLTVSSLPINENLVRQGLLNNRDSQFLFSGLLVPGGADGTPDFDPGPLPASGRYGDITVQQGAVLKSTPGGGGDGGRILLAGSNITNAGTISTDSGQTILASGLQVAVAAHEGNDPSLRGLDVWVGDVGDYGGTTTNSGIIQALEGSISMTGSHLNQLGLLDSSTSVALNGRIDIKASYGAVSNPNFDSTTQLGAGGPQFFNQYTGLVTFGTDSATRILPDYLSKQSVPGTALPERSQINVEGNVIHFDKGSTMLAPNAEVSIRAGTWPYKDGDGNRTIFDADGNVEAGVNNFYTGSQQRFFLNEGQIYVDEHAAINVAGSTDVFVPLTQSILQVQLRGSELADSPLVRDTVLRGQTLTVDIRDTGIYNGKYWIGTPLGDVTGLAGIIERNAAQLTAVGGDINMESGGSIVIASGSTVDVSGGYFSHEGGLVKTSALVTGGQLVDIKDATPNLNYDGVFNGESVFNSKKWGVENRFSTSLLTGRYEKGFVEGAAGGTLSLSAGSMAIDGKLKGLTVNGPRQRATPAPAASLRINFGSEKTFIVPGSSFLNFISTSLTPPAVTFTAGRINATTPIFSLNGDLPTALPEDRTASVALSSRLFSKGGFGSLEIVNPDGSISVPADVTLDAGSRGKISFTAANLTVLGKLIAPGGSLSFTTLDISPTVAEESSILNPPGSIPFLDPVADRGRFILGERGFLSTAGLLVNDSQLTDDSDLTSSTVIDGGTISIRSYQADLAKGGRVDVSGGAYDSVSKKISYGAGGAMILQAGKDPGFSGLVGGSITLDSTLKGYSGGRGGSLTIQAGRIQIGGDQVSGALNLKTDFFNKGGFTTFDLTGIGAASGLPPGSDGIESYLPAVSIAANTKIIPVATSFMVVPDSDGSDGIALQKFVNEKGLRSPVNLSFNALGSDDPFTIDQLEIRGDIHLGESALIKVEPGAAVSFNGQTVTLLGSVVAPGGKISVSGASSFPLTTEQKFSQTQALPTVHIGGLANLSAAGVRQLVPDAFGRQIGKVYGGGSISISGNILAESGAVIDVSGSSGILDVAPAMVVGSPVLPIAGSGGLLSAPLQIQGTPTRVDSNGGIIDLTGSQMLLSDATLLGSAGGRTATGGMLSVSSGNFYRVGESRTGADTNLWVRQSGDVILNPTAPLGVGITLLDQNGEAYGNSGYFSVDRFTDGAFASLSLGGKYLSQASPIPYGGNVSFEGPIHIKADGSVRLAAGGVIHADSSVRIAASYIAIGQDFLTPQNPDDVHLAFQVDPGAPSNEHHFAPTSGTGGLHFRAGLIDIGTLSLQNISTAELVANGGDIRGNGTIGIAGDLTLKAAQIYPTTLGNFNIFAYDHDGIASSVMILKSGSATPPLSAGGNLSIYASNIIQSGVLRAPLGTIRLGWDGSDLDPTDPDLDAPYDLIAGSTIAAPLTSQVTLQEGSLTSVSAKGLKIPFGISPDGTTWIDPRGVNVTLSGLPDKNVYVQGGEVKMVSGATVDIQGGGDLFATRWIPGNGGSVDLLGAAAAPWGGGTSYAPGDLVTYNGETYSARVSHIGQTPGPSNYWTKVAESYAIVPELQSSFAPFNPFNTGDNATALGGDPGFVSNLKVGDTITVESGSEIPAGTYTLLPRRYAFLDGAFLVTPVNDGGIGAVQLADGSVRLSGYLANNFNQPLETTTLRSRFEIASQKVLENRVTYSVFGANKFIADAAAGTDSGIPQFLPSDAGHVAFEGSLNMHLDGNIQTNASGRGASVDISSSSEIVIIGMNASPPVGASVVLNSNVLSSWNADSLLIGGIRRNGPDGTIVDVQTGDLTVDNSGESLSGPEIILVSKGEITVTKGSSINSVGTMKSPSGSLLIAGDGALVRVSGDSSADILRTGVSGSSSPLLSIGSSTSISGNSVILDSTYGTSLSDRAVVSANALTLGSGQISVVFGDPGDAPIGSLFDPHLTLAGITLDNVQKSSELTLQSYSSIDFHGAGTFGSADLSSLTLRGGGIRGYQQGGDQVVIQAGNVTFENSSDVNAPPIPAVNSGELKIISSNIHLGANQFAVAGYQNLILDASTGITAQDTGSFVTAGDLNSVTPVISGLQGAIYQIGAAGDIQLSSGGDVVTPMSALGASLTIEGASIVTDTNILLPSGQLTLRATIGSLEIGGNLAVDGTARNFQDLTRYSNAGEITLESLGGNVTVGSTGHVSVSAAATGGMAGTINVRAVNGTFTNEGQIEGRSFDSALLDSSITAGHGGSISLDVSSFKAVGKSSFDSISDSLDAGGFFTSRNFRVRRGDVTIANMNHSDRFSLSTDQGSILVTGAIDVSGEYGGQIYLSAHGDLTLASGAFLRATGETFDSAGKGGSITLEAGTQRDGMANSAALLDLQTGSTIDLSVADYVAGSYTDVGSSAFGGRFTGTLHLRAPRTSDNKDLRIGSLNGDVFGASSIVAEGFKVYQPGGGILDIAQRTQIDNDAKNFLGSPGVGNANESAMRSRLLGVNSGLDSVLVIAPGVEIINPTGDLTLGVANNSDFGSNNREALASADWDLSSFRYGTRAAPGVLTLRANGDLIFNNTLSDGFVPVAQATFDNGHSFMWLATLQTISDSLPSNTQSWSYRLTAGADTNASAYSGVLSQRELNLTQPSKGSVIVGEFYPAIPNFSEFGLSAAVGANGQTANTIRISINTSDRGNRFEVVRTGTGDIAITAGRDVQLRNQFSTIYTAGVALPTPTAVFGQDDFVVPTIPSDRFLHPNQSAGGLTLGAIQQIYQPAWSMAGGNIVIAAQANVGRYTEFEGEIIADSSRQLPSNWIYRRGYVDASTGLFASDGGFGNDPNVTLQNAENVNDSAPSTTWWIDYSNFFQGVGTLGGGNIDLSAGGDVVNVDAVAPTNARMSGRAKNPDFGVLSGAPEFINLAPDEKNLLEFGGGDIRVTAGRNIDGGIYYVEKGKGALCAGGSITTNASRSISLGILDGSQPLDPLTWLPTTLFVGKSSFDVIARGDVLLGPVSNPFLLPQGLNNKYWYKTVFSTFAPDSGITVSSYGGGITHRMASTLAGSASATPILESWINFQNLFNGVNSVSNPSNFQPWLRLNEVSTETYGGALNLSAPNLRSTAFGGDINLVGSWTLAPSAIGTLELASAGGIIGLQQTGPGNVRGRNLQIWSSASINVSDASISSIPGVATPLAYQSVIGRSRTDAAQSNVNLLQNVSVALAETGSYRGQDGTAEVKQALHGAAILHSVDPNPVRIYADGGDITGLQLFSPKETRIIAQRDISDVAFYLQNTSEEDVSLVSSGRDIVPFNENTPIRVVASDLNAGNYVGDVESTTLAGNITTAKAGDIQINGPGVLEVLSGRNIDLGSGANFVGGTGVGITSIGNNRNPNLPFGGADVIALAGVSSRDSANAAGGLSESSLFLNTFIEKYIDGNTIAKSPYLKKLGIKRKFSSLTSEQQAIVALEKFYQLLRKSGHTSSKLAEILAAAGSTDAPEVIAFLTKAGLSIEEIKNFKGGYGAIKNLFGKGQPDGEILTQAREIRTTSGGSISLGVPGGGITMASGIFGNPLTPPGIVTEYGGNVATFTRGDVNIGQARIFTLRGGDITMWSSNGNIAAGTSPRTVVTAPPTRVVIDINSADVQTDLGGLATGGGIGVLAAVEGVEPGNVDLIAPKGFVDAGDAGIRVTGNLNIAAQVVLNSNNISAGGTTTGAAPASVSAPSVGAITGASNSGSAVGTTISQPPATQPQAIEKPTDLTSTLITVDVIGYGETESEDSDNDEKKDKPQL